MKSFRSGRGGSSLRGKTNNTKLTAPLPVNLPSRRHEKGGHDVSLVSAGSSWGSPSAPSSSVLATASSLASSPATDSNGQLSGPGTPAGQGSDSPQLDTSAGSPFQKPAPRAWGVVAQTHEQRLDDYPTAAEAAKKIQEQHEHHQTNGHTNTNSSNAGNSSKRTIAPSNTNSGEPMAKTVSALSSGADNWDEADEDESVDFLNAEAIEFADGSVVVASAVAHPADGQNDSEAPQTAPQSNQREERVVERGEVDFNRAWPNRHQPVPGPGLYQPNTEPVSRFGSQDRSHQTLWQGGPHERRPSNERPSHHPSQRRESFGSRDGQGPPRRDSAGPKEPFAPPRRDSGGRDDRRDSFNRTGSYNREREPYHHRDNEYSSDRRPSHDRPPYTSERFPDRHQRDFQLLTRPKEAINDHLGPHDPLPANQNHAASPVYSHQHTPGSRGPYESIHPRDSENRAPGYGQMGPPGAIEYDRPANVTEDQREAMKHAAEEARKRREEEEKRFEEGKARAKAKAAELAKQAEEAKIAKAKEEEAAMEAEQAKKKDEDEAARKKSEIQASTLDHTATSPASQDAQALETVRESGALSVDDKKAALAQLQALPDRLVREETDRISRVREERRLKVEDEQKTAAVNPPSAVTTGVSSVGPWRRSGNVVTGKYTSDAVSKSDNISAKKDERPRETAKSATANAHGHAAPPEVRVEQLDKVMHRIEESLQGRKNSLQATDAASVKRSSEGVKTTEAVSAETSTVEAVGIVSSGDTAVDPSKSLATTLSGKPAVKERVRDGKAGRAEITRGESPPTWRNAKSVATGSEEKSSPNTPESKNGMEATSSEPSADDIQSERRLDDERLKAASEVVGRGKYPAKMSGIKGSAKISDISKIHARLSRQTAGERGLDLEVQSVNERDDNTKRAPHSLLSKAGGKSADAGTQKSIKRNSLLTSTTATIFPSNVEKAAKNRRSMSFMVDSEIDNHLEDASKAIDTTVSKEAKFSQESVQSKEAPLQREDEKNAPTHAAPSSIKETDANDNIKKAWDATHTMDPRLDPAGLSKVEDAGRYHPGQLTPSSSTNVAQGAAMGPGVYMMSSSAPGMVNSMSQHMWSAPMSVESSQAGATMAPFPMIMPYYQGYPVSGPPLYYLPRGPMPPQMAQFPAGAIPPPGSVPMFPRNGLGGSSASQGLPDVSSAVPVDLKSDAANSGALNSSGSFLAPHHWLPRFSAAGDAPAQQAGVVGGSFLATVPVSQQANMIAAANINRAPQSRPYAHHQQHQPRLQNSGAASLDSSFQERSSSPTSTDGWSSSTTIASASTISTNPSNNGGRFHTQGAAAGSPSWTPPNGRMNPNGPGGGAGPYGNYQQPQQHSHAGSGYRGRGGFSGGYNNFRPRGGHMNQAQHYGGGGGANGSMQVGAGYGYGHANMNGQQSHGGPGSGASSTSGSVDQQQHQGHNPGRTVSHDSNAGNAFAPPYSHRSPHMHAAAANAGGEIQF